MPLCCSGLEGVSTPRPFERRFVDGWGDDIATCFGRILGAFCKLRFWGAHRRKVGCDLASFLGGDWEVLNRHSLWGTVLPFVITFPLLQRDHDLCNPASRKPSF